MWREEKHEYGRDNQAISHIANIAVSLIPQEPERQDTKYSHTKDEISNYRHVHTEQPARNGQQEKLLAAYHTAFTRISGKESKHSKWADADVWQICDNYRYDKCQRHPPTPAPVEGWEQQHRKQFHACSTREQNSSQRFLTLAMCE